MLDFRRRARSRPAPSPRVPARLLSLVLLLLLVMLAMGQVREARFWHLLFGPAADPAPADRPAPPLVRLIGEAPPDDAPPPDPAGFVPGVRTDYLSQVRDNQWFLPRESDAWFNLLEILRDTPSDQLARHSLGRVTYAQLANQSGEYRGRVVTVAGTIRRALRKPAAANSSGFVDYWQLTLEPRGEPSSPIIIYCLQLPPSFPTGQQVTAEVTITGFSFKRWLYPSEGGHATAPLLLAAGVRWQPPPPAPVDQGPTLRQVLLYGLLPAAAIAALVLLGMWRYSPGRAPEADPQADPALAALADLQCEGESPPSGP